MPTLPDPLDPLKSSQSRHLAHSQTPLSDSTTVEPNLHPSDSSRLQNRLQRARLYLCTDARREHGDLLDFAAAAFAGGVDILQLRDKGSIGEQQFGPLAPATQKELIAQLQPIASQYNCLLAVNDIPTLASESCADILHLGQKDESTIQARNTLTHPTKLIGQSTHALHQAIQADQDHCVDYFSVGPIWPTPTKPGRSATGLSYVQQVSALQPVKPWFAIGGIDHVRVAKVMQAGARRIVVVRAITSAKNPERAARQLRELVEQFN